MKVSIVITTYNSQETILRALNSAITQTYKNLEVIVVDDCSSDRTISIIETFKKSNPDIFLLSTKKNTGGPSIPRNLGIKKASGEALTFLDADDYWLPEKIERQVLCGYSFSFTSYIRVKSGKSRLIKSYFKKVSASSLVWHNPIALSSVFIKSDLIRGIGFEEICNEDLFFYMDILKLNGNNFIEYIDIPLVKYTVGVNSRSSKKVFLNICRIKGLISHGNPLLPSLLSLITHPLTSLIRNVTAKKV